MRVCLDKYPPGYSNNKKPGFYLEPILKAQLDIMLKNIKRDWDFTIVISAGGEVRVGKSVLAMQIGAYWTYEIKRLYGIVVPFNAKENFVFTGGDLINTGNRLGQNHPYSCLVFDEAGSELEGRKSMRGSTQNVLDFFRECGQYNLLNILVIPEYFDLPKTIALTRSVFLIDAYYSSNLEGVFTRGYYNFYSRRNKKNLYLKGKKEYNYKAHPYNFHGRFSPFYPIDEADYREQKRKALTNREEDKKKAIAPKLSLMNLRARRQRDTAWYILDKKVGMNKKEIARQSLLISGVAVSVSTVRDSINAIVSELKVAKGNTDSVTTDI